MVELAQKQEGKVQMGLQGRMIVYISGLIILVSVILSVFFIRQYKEQVYKSLEKTGLVLTESLAYNSEYGLSIANEEILSKVIKGTIEVREEKIIYVAIQDKHGKIIASSGLDEMRELFQGKINREALESIESNVAFHRVDDRPILDIVVPVWTGGEEMLQSEVSLLPDKREDESITKKIGVVRVGISQEEAVSEVRKGIVITILLSFLTVLVGILLSFLLAKNLIVPIKELLKGTQQVAHGDLSSLVEIKGENEIGLLAKGFNLMTKSLSSLVVQLRNAALQITSTSVEMLSASEQQTSGATEQAAAVTETTATVEELAAASKSIAHTSDKLVEKAESTLQTAQEGEKAIEKIMQGMNEIKVKTQDSAKNILALGEKSQRIGQVIEIINDIADQTNLLALNAAIEAARAGEAGKGFAVVAVEVKKLAENVVMSTKQVKDVISEIQSSTNNSVMATEEGIKGVDRGVVLAHKGGTVLQEILGMIKDTTSAAKQIGLATQQQRSATDQAVITMKQIAEVSNQSVTSAKQITSASRQLGLLAKRLKEMVERFKIK